MDRSSIAVDGTERAARLRIAVWAGLVVIFAMVSSLATAQDLQKFAEGRQVMMIRHAYAPGTGDPANFRIGDCSTQRNLNGEGRTQAERLGAYIRAQGIDDAEVLTSQWCRCSETAELLDVGDVEEFTGLNSFYTVREKKDEWLTELRDRLILLGRRTDEPVIMVTHAVTIAAIAGVSASSGEAVLLDLNGTAEPAFAKKVTVR